MTSPKSKTPDGPGPDRYRDLLETSRRLSATLTAKELYEAIYQETSAAVEASGFYLALYDQSRDLARIVLYSDDGAVNHVDLSYRGTDSEVFRTQAGLLVNENLEDVSLLVLGDAGTKLARSALTTPMIHDGRLIGAVSAQSYEAGAYDQDDLELLQSITDIAAVAVHNSIQFEELERRRLEAEQLEEISRALTSELDPEVVQAKVISAVQEVLSVDGSAIWLCDLDGTSVCRVAESGGDIALPIGLDWDLTGEVKARILDEREPIILDNLQATEVVPEQVAEHLTGGSAIGAPVLVNGQVAGVLTAGSRQPRRFTADDTAVLQRLANQCAVALGNARLHADLHALSLTDPLTGLPNRRRLQIHLEHEVAAARRGRPLGLVIFDIDRFKYYNDTFGHIAGDEILKIFAGLLREENRAMNIVARYGGDEFVSVLSETSIDGVRHYIERVQERVAGEETLSSYELSVSAGGASFDPETMATVNDALRAADADMYDQKQAQGTPEKGTRKKATG